MEKSIKISNNILPNLLQRIGEAIGSGKDMIIEEYTYPSVRYVYTEIPGEQKKILETEGDSEIKVNPEENMSYSEEEIKMMENYKYCPEAEDSVDQYYCEFLCPTRTNCSFR